MPKVALSKSSGGHAILPIWHGMNILYFTGRSMNSLLRLSGATVLDTVFDIRLVRLATGGVASEAVVVNVASHQ